MFKSKYGSTLVKSLVLSTFLASQTVLLQGCGALGIEAPESGVVASSEITTTEAVEAASTVSSVEEDKADPVIYRVSDGSKEKDYYFEELDNDIYDYGKLRFNIIANGKSYVFFEREYPENNYDRAYRLGIVDLETREYKEVPVESELVDLCKNYTDDLEGYEEKGDNYFAVAPDETSYHEALRIFSDENENAGVYFSRFGVDKEGNVFALVHFGHVYWGNGQLNFEDGDYELLKWSPEGEFQLPRKVFNEDSLSEMMADEAVGYDAYGDEYNRFMHLLKENGEFLADIECIGKVSDQQFVGFFFDNENSELHMGIFTQTEGSANESDSLSDCLWTRDEAKEITIPLELSLQEGRHELYIPA